MRACRVHAVERGADVLPHDMHDGREQDGKHEADARNDRREAGAGARGHAGGAFNVRGDGAGAEERPDAGGGGVADESTPRAGEAAVVADIACLFPDADQGADGVEEVHEEQQGNSGERLAPVAKQGAEIEVEKRFGGPRDGGLGPGENAGEESQSRCGQDPDEDADTHAKGHQRGGQEHAANGHEGHGRRKPAQRDHGGGAGLDDAAPLHADKGYEQADTGPDGVLEAFGKDAHQPLARAEQREQQEEHAGDEHDGQARLP